jgi:hypothetical protein
MDIEMDMKAVIIYEECALGSKAIALLKQASIRADDSAPWKIAPWRLELLCLPAFAEESLREAFDAHLVLLALLRRPEVSPWLLRWLEQWAARRYVRDAALAVFEGNAVGSLAFSAAPELLAFAENNGLSFVFGDAIPTPETAGSLVQAPVWRDESWAPTGPDVREKLSSPWSIPTGGSTSESEAGRGVADAGL